MGGGFNIHAGTGQFLGHGGLLHTRDGGQVWENVPLTNSDAGAGTVSHFLEKTWDGIGPISAINSGADGLTGGAHFTNVWIATASGIFLSTNALSPKPQWKRVTPSPADPDGYSYFCGMESVDAEREFYAYGWQGIAHWERGSPWTVQLRTYKYGINDLCVVDRWKPEAWAAGWGADKSNPGGLSDCGAIYHLTGPDGAWERVLLNGIQLLPQQGLNAIIKLRLSEGLIAVGQGGVILRSTEGGTNRIWRKIEPVKNSLTSITYDSHHTLWVVGELGTALKSVNDGESWTVYPCLDPYGKPITDNLSRLTFDDEGQAWALGGERVLKCDLR